MNETKKRHWLLTTYLVLAIVLLSIGYILLGQRMGAFMIKFPDSRWIFYATRFNFLFHIMCLVAIFRWKKWGFYGAGIACIVSVVLLIIISGNVIENMYGLLGIAILYGILQIGGERKGWTQLG